MVQAERNGTVTERTRGKTEEDGVGLGKGASGLCPCVHVFVVVKLFTGSVQIGSQLNDYCMRSVITYEGNVKFLGPGDYSPNALRHQIFTPLTNL